MIPCLLELLLHSPLVLNALSQQTESKLIGRNVLTFYHCRDEPAFRAYIIAYAKRELQECDAPDSPAALWVLLLRKCGVANISKIAYAKEFTCDLCSLRNTHQIEYFVLKVNLFDRTGDVNLLRILPEYEDKGIIPDQLEQYLANTHGCKQPLQIKINWNCLGESMYFSFDRIGSNENAQSRSVAKTNVTLPLVIAFAAKSFELYAIIRQHKDPASGAITYDAVVFDISRRNRVTTRAARIDENGVKTRAKEFNDLRSISSTTVVLALYDDILAKNSVPLPMVDKKPAIETLTHITQLQNRDDLPIESDEWTKRLMSTRRKDYVIHDVLPTRFTSQNYLKHYFAAMIGEHGFIWIIRHFVDEKKVHDHIIHDCAWPEGDCHCELIKKKIQPQRANRQVIARNNADRSFFTALLQTLKVRNVIYAYSDGKLHIDQFFKDENPNRVDAYIEHSQIDWPNICDVDKDMSF